MPVSVYFGLSLFLLLAGIFMVLTRRNVVVMLMGVELILNAANLNFIGFGQLHPGAQGWVFALFVMVVAASEAAVALALILHVYQRYRTVEIDRLNRLKH